jgi:putative peptidoglycan lipid II flippase
MKLKVSGWRLDLRDMVVMGLLLAVARGAVLLRDIYIAAKYGVSGIVDSFNIAFTIISWPSQVVISVVTIIVVPILVRLAAQGKANERAQLVRELNFSIVAIALFVAAIILIFSRPLCVMFTSSLDPSTAMLTLKMTRWFAPLAFIMIITGYFSARLQALRNNLFTLFEGFPAVAMIAVLLLLDGWVTYRGDSLIVGMLAGTCLQCAALVLLLSRNREWLGTLHSGHSSPHWRSLYAAVGTMALGQVILSLVLPIDQYFLAQLGNGEVARYGYAMRVVSLINMLGTTVIGRVLLPSFSDFIARNELASARRYALNWAFVIVVLGIIFCVFAEYPMGKIVRLLFQHGKFTPLDVERTTNMVKILVFQIPFFLSGQVFVQWFASIGKYIIMLYAAIFSLTAKFVFLFFMVGKLDIRDVLLSMVLVYFVSCFYLFVRVLLIHD